jgi:hypothetical protein
MHLLLEPLAGGNAPTPPFNQDLWAGAVYRVLRVLINVKTAVQGKSKVEQRLYSLRRLSGRYQTLTKSQSSPNHLKQSC